MDKGFLVEDDLIRLINPVTGTKEVAMVVATEMANFDHKWSEYIAAGATSGPEEITLIEPAEDRRELYQGVYAPRENILLTPSLPSNIRLRGFPNLPKALSSNRRVGVDDNISSPFENPDFGTEFFLRGNTNLSKLNLDAFNPTSVNLKPRVRFIVNKMLVTTKVDTLTLAKITAREMDIRTITIGGLPSTSGEVLRG